MFGSIVFELFDLLSICCICCLPAAIINASGSNSSESDDPLLRSSRPRRRAKDERGLPDRPVLMDLAQTYLVEQRRLWPELANTELLPAPTRELLDSMAADFERRFRTGIVDIFNFPVGMP